jgi:hypothetical protein
MLPPKYKPDLRPKPRVVLRTVVAAKPIFHCQLTLKTEVRFPNNRWQNQYSTATYAQNQVVLRTIVAGKTNILPPTYTSKPRSFSELPSLQNQYSSPLRPKPRPFSELVSLENQYSNANFHSKPSFFSGLPPQQNQYSTTDFGSNVPRIQRGLGGQHQRVC